MEVAEAPVADVTFARCRRAAALFKAGNVDEGLPDIVRLADDGYAPAQTLLGWAYEVGRGVPLDAEAAMGVYRAAAESGYRVGQYYFGVFLYRRGDAAGGVEWIRRAAEQNYAPALYRLGRLYGAGTVAPKDETKEEKYMLRAAELGHPFAQRWIARRALTGREGLWGILRALRWFASVPWLAFKLGSDDETDPNLLYP